MRPANLPKPLLDKLHAEIVRALREPDVIEKLTSARAIVVASTPPELAAHIKTEMEKSARIVKRVRFGPNPSSFDPPSGGIPNARL